MSDCPACGGPLSPWLSVPAGEPSDPRLVSPRALRALRERGDGRGAAGAAGVRVGRVRVPAASLRSGRSRFAAAGRPPGRRAASGAGPRVLDAGAGRGRLVASLRRAGVHGRAGIDPSGRGDLVERRAIEEHTDADLDGVVMWHVLEHLDDPGCSARTGATWLRPGGRLVVAVPNLASWQARIAGPGWLHFDAPRHRVHFTASGLRALLTPARASLASARSTWSGSTTRPRCGWRC